MQSLARGRSIMTSKESSLPQHTGQGTIRYPPEIPLSPTVILLSAAWWISVFIVVYIGYGYVSLYRSIDNTDLNEICGFPQPHSLSKGIEFIDDYPKGDAGPYLLRLGSEKYSSGFVGTPSPQELTSIPPILTALDSSKFFVVQGLVRDVVEKVSPAFKDAKLIIYDLGLYETERELLKKYCHCELRKFESSAYPNHVADVWTFAWKPVIIQAMLEEFGSVLWIDPSARLKNVKDLNQLKYRGSKDFSAWEPPTFSPVIAYTDQKMFKALGENRCSFKDTGMVDLGSLLFYRTNVTWRGIMKPWLKCALNKECIAPSGARYSGCLEFLAPKTTGCHRFDQSALSIILNRVFQFSFYAEKFQIPRLTIPMSDISDTKNQYFPEQPWTFTQLGLLVAFPLTLVCILYYILLRRRRARALYRKR